MYFLLKKTVGKKSHCHFDQWLCVAACVPVSKLPVSGVRGPMSHAEIPRFKCGCRLQEIFPLPAPFQMELVGQFYPFHLFR